MAQNTPYKPEPPPVLPFHKHLVAGGAAGLVELLVMHPTDVIKTRLQVQGVEREYGNTMRDAARRIVANEGYGAFYKGIIPPAMYEVPKRATKFASFQFYKKLISDSSGNLTAPRAILCGAAAGCTEAFVVSPFEVVKIALQSDTSSGGARKYKSTLDCAAQIIRNEGLGAVYKGITSTLWRNAVFNGAFFTINQEGKKLWPWEITSKAADVTRTIGCGFVAGVISTVLNTPFDVVKTKIQKQPVPKRGEVPRYRGVFQGLGVVMAEEGVKGLYKGFVPKVMRLGPGGAIMFLMFDTVSHWLAKE